MTRDRSDVGQYLKSWKPTVPSKTYFTDFSGGGVLWVGALYKWHIFTSSGSFQAPVTTADVIVVAGGGGAERGGGGAGGVRNLIAVTFVVGTSYTVTIGAAGVNATTTTKGGTSSIVTSITTISATGGGKSHSSVGGSAGIGGCGGGAYSTGVLAGAAGNEGAYTPAEGYAGSGPSDNASPAPYGNYGKSGGGGGASAAAYAARTHNNTTAYNDDNGGIGGLGVALPTDVINAPIFASVLAITNASDANIYVGQGGMGGGYKNVNSYYEAPAQLWQGSFSRPRNGNNGYLQNAVSFGCGGSVGATASAGLIIVRYAL